MRWSTVNCTATEPTTCSVQKKKYIKILSGRLLNRYFNTSPQKLMHRLDIDIKVITHLKHYLN